MIKVDKITIEQFRGIRALTLGFNGQSFAVCGPNGTGKSGVVDAVEFALTGSISRLTGKGRGDLSVLKHGPHVDSGKTPEKAKVTLEGTIPSLGKRITITRDVKNMKSPVITPDEPEVRAALQTFVMHPEFVLSRREIIKYVLAEPAERAKQVQALLQLDDLEAARVVLQKISNACNKGELLPLKQDETSTYNALLRAMEITELSPEMILAAANEKRKVLGLPELPKLAKGSSLRDGLESLGAAAVSRVPKPQARTDIAATLEAVKVLSSQETKAEIAKAVEAVNALKADEANLKALAKESLLRTALSVFDDHACPVCETEWKPDHFRKVVNEQLQRLSAATKARTATEELVAPVARKVGAARAAIRTLASYGPLFTPPFVLTELNAYSSRLETKETAMRKLLPLADTLASLDVEEANSTPALAELEAMSKLVEAIPEPTDRDAARDYLTVADERLQAYRIAAAKAKAGERRAEIAKQVFETFEQATNEALEEIYKQVEGEFKRFYREINEDEAAFEAELSPSIGKLSFGVDFYGRGSFPPGAYHSEGHQDAMGLCLYLALMKHILGDGFSLAVLDDVLMSVDTGHRREVCRLLKAEFPNTQFVLTTHDPVWLRHMKTAGLIEAGAGVEFQSWNVDDGPTQWKDIDVWGEINDFVDKNEIALAASRLRNYLEYLAAEYCSQLGGKVEYRGDNRYELGDLLPAAAKALRTRIKEAKDAATSWVNAELLAKVEAREKAFDKASLDALGKEWWQINLVIHYNDWVNMGKADFKPVADAFKALADQFICESCSGTLYTTWSGYDRDALRCPCPEINFTLSKKK